jgi:hypothetical protein
LIVILISLSGIIILMAEDLGAKANKLLEKLYGPGMSDCSKGSHLNDLKLAGHIAIPWYGDKLLFGMLELATENKPKFGRTFVLVTCTLASKYYALGNLAYYALGSAGMLGKLGNVF